MKSDSAPNSSSTKSRIPEVFRTLRYRNFRLFFGGQLISLVGTWMQQLAVTWLVYRLTNSAFILGMVGFLSQLPSFLLTSVAGVFADRFNRHRMVIITQALAMVQASILAILTLTGTITITEIVVLMIFLGCINAFDIPIRQSFLLEMVENKEDLGNAIAINSSMFNGARLLGPSIAGLFIAALGEGLCFLLNAVSFIAVIVALLAMKIKQRVRIAPKHGVLKGYKEGLRYVTGFAPIRYILLQLAIVSFMGMPYAVLMPIFAGQILHGGANTLGFLMGAIGIGAFTGAIFLASRKNALGLGKWIPIASAIFGTALAVFSFSTNQLVSIMILPFVGFGMMVQMAASNTMVQTISDDDKRGRVMSFYTMAFAGTMPFGSLFAGSLASRIGAPHTLLISGIVCIIGALFFTTKLQLIRKEIRPIYRKIGILPDLPSTLEDSGPIAITPETH